MRNFNHAKDAIGYVEPKVITTPTKVLFPDFHGRKSCASCAHWVECDPGRFHTEGKGYVVGECRRRSPIVSTSGNQRTVTTWPTTKSTDVCGEYEAAKIGEAA